MLGGAGVVGLAGCTGGDGGSDGGSGDGGSDGGSGDGESDGGSGDGGSGDGGGAERTIQYGVLLPLTGDLGSVGTPMRDAAVLPTTLLEGEDLGGISVENQVEDTQTDPSSGISAANALINAGIPGVCGPASSGVNIQVANQVFIPNQIVGCSPSSTAPTVTNLEDDDFIFRTAPSDALQGQVMAQVANENLGVSSAATLYVNNDYGQLLSQAFTDAFESADGTVQTQTSFEKAQSSYTSKLQSALSDSPDLLVIIGYPESGTQMFLDYYADFEGEEQIMVTDGLKDSKMQQQIGNPMENVIGTAPLPSGPASEAFASAFEEEYGEAPGIFTAHSFDASAVLVLANARAGENSGPAVRDAMREVANPGGTEVSVENMAEGVRMAAAGEEIQYVGASSSVDFDDNGDMSAVSYEVWEFAPDTESGFETVNTVEFSGSN